MLKTYRIVAQDRAKMQLHRLTVEATCPDEAMQIAERQWAGKMDYLWADVCTGGRCVATYGVIYED